MATETWRPKFRYVLLIEHDMALPAFLSNIADHHLNALHQALRYVHFAGVIGANLQTLSMPVRTRPKRRNQTSLGFSSSE